MQRTGSTFSGMPSAAMVVAGVVTVGLVASVVAARYTGAADAMAGGLTDAGPVVRWALPLVRVVHDVAASLTIGSLLLAATIIPGRTRAESAAPDEPRRAAAFRVATAAAFVWAVAGAVGVVFTFADAAGMPPSDPPSAATSPGRCGASRCCASASSAPSRRSSWRLSPRAVARSVAVALTAALGARPARPRTRRPRRRSADHETAVNALAAHLLSAAVWVGGLLALIVLRGPLGESLGVVGPPLLRPSPSGASSPSASPASCRRRRDSGRGPTSPRRTASSSSSRWSPSRPSVSPASCTGAVDPRPHRRRPTPRRRRRRGAASARGARGRLFVRLAVVETLVMGLAFGVATALARSEPPVPETVADPSAALSLTGYPAPPAPTALSWVTAWRVEWLFLATGLLAIGLYVAGVVRLRRRGDAWPVLRTLSWVVGWLLFLYATNGVLGIYGRVAFSWHMTLHMLEAMVLPIFLVLGAPVTLALRTVKPRRDGTLGPREMLLAMIHSRLPAVVGNPIFAAAFFFMSLVVFYWTGLFQLALQTHTGHLLMTAHFVVAGYLFAWVLVGVDPGPKRWSPALRLVVLFATIAFHAFFGVAMISGTTLLGGDFFPTIAIPWVGDPLADQRYGGGVAWAIGELPSLVLALTVALQWFRTDSAESVRQDRPCRPGRRCRAHGIQRASRRAGCAGRAHARTAVPLTRLELRRSAARTRPDQPASAHVRVGP